MMGGVTTVAGGNELGTLLEVMSDPVKYKTMLAQLQAAKDAADAAAAKLDAAMVDARKEHDAQIRQISAEEAASNEAAAKAASAFAAASQAQAKLDVDTATAYSHMASREANVIERENEAKNTRDDFKTVSQNLIKQKQELDAREKQLGWAEEDVRVRAEEADKLKADYEARLAQLRSLL